MNKFIEIFKPNKSKKFNNLLNIFGIKNKKEIYNTNNTDNNNPCIYISCNISYQYGGTPFSPIIKCGNFLYIKQMCLYGSCGTPQYIRGYCNIPTDTNITNTYTLKYISIDKMKTDSYELTSYEDFCKIHANYKGISIAEVKEQFVEITAEEFWNQYENWK